jgi:hypothetical protein
MTIEGAVSLALSASALIIALWTQRRQPELTRRQIAEYRAREAAATKARVRAHLDAGGFWLENEGEATGRFVDITALTSRGVDAVFDRKQLPLPQLEPGQRALLTFFREYGGGAPFQVVIAWENPDGSQDGYEGAVYDQGARLS